MSLNDRKTSKENAPNLYPMLPLRSFKEPKWVACLLLELSAPGKASLKGTNYSEKGVVLSF